MLRIENNVKVTILDLCKNIHTINDVWINFHSKMKKEKIVNDSNFMEIEVKKSYNNREGIMY